MTTTTTTRSGRSPNGKLAGQVARRIHHDIVKRGWPVGEVLGSETQLLERYQVSRAVFREAVRLVEHQQVGRMRRGPGGGLVITEPDARTVIEAVTVYLLFARVTVDELFEARSAVEEAAVELITGHVAADAVARLRQSVDAESTLVAPTPADHRVLHQLLTTMTGNPAIELFVEILVGLSDLYVISPVDSGGRSRASSEAVSAHAALVDAIASGDAGLARRRMRGHLDGLRQWLRSHNSSGTPSIAALDAPAASGKLAEAVGRRILAEVVEAGWPLGELLGSEAELMDRYGVSRAVLREAVRLLEHHQIAAMRRGPGGGLIVTEPGATATTDAAAHYLEYRGITGHALYEVRAALELASLALVVDRLDDAGAARLRACVAEEDRVAARRLNQAGHELHVAIAELSGNRALWLFTLVLSQLTAEHIDRAPRPGAAKLAKMAESMRRAHAAIVDAIVAGDADLASRRMRRHLEAVEPWLA